ncbi:bleomycin hydrolase-like [Drosophila novamexicana]|uniref:bleomycin hydrolase-like n=2 Tax=Drosophila novamexicana TaxID=47314 RepID=UPI0011E58908|nr:bleomycin hydrolase-like [Drosophila novamexicana]
MGDSPPITACFTLEKSQLSTWRSEFFTLPINRLAQNICTACDPISACMRQDQKSLTMPGKEHYEVTKLAKSTVGGPKWICAGLDLLRLSMRKDCELSAPYLFYWHKLERCNYFLHTVIELLARCEPIDGRTFKYLMKHTVPDGGNWQMFVNLIQKYGAMPKQSYLASWSSTRSLHLNKMLRSKLHEFSCRLHAKFTFDGDSHMLRLIYLEPMIEELYKIISICLGTPPVNFTWSLKDEDQRLVYTPLSFYQAMIEPYFSRDAQVCLGHDPRLTSIYHRNYHIANSSNMIDGLQQRYINQPMEILLEAIVKSLAAGSAVWLACDLPVLYNTKSDVLSLKAYHFDQVFGMPVDTALDKAERMLYKATRRNTVLLLTEVTLDAMRQPLQFRTMRKATEPTTTKKTESSDSLRLPEAVDADAEAKQYAVKRKVASGKATVLNVDWLREYAFEIVVDSRYVPPGVMHALQTQPSVELPVWDPMGALLS